MELTKKQKEFLELTRQGKNIYLSGKAGTGKSTVIKKFVEESEGIVCLGTSGVAAMNIKGQTLHSYFGLSFGKIFSEKEVKPVREPEPVKKAKIIVIDEVSMLRSDVLENVKHAMKKSKIDYLEKQYIFVGDLAQLPPIVSPEEKFQLEEEFGGVNFHDSHFFKELDVVHIDLDEVVRQSDSEFIDNLNLIRGGGKSDYFKRFVSDEVKGIVLAPHNSTVDKYNQEGLSKLKGRSKVFHASVHGNVKAEDFNVQERLELKEGARIMYLVNSTKKGLVNGSLGTFCMSLKRIKVPYTIVDRYNRKVKRYTYSTEMVPCIKLEDGRTVHLEEYTFEKIKYNSNLEKEVIGYVKALPVRLAFALSIHKSQGLTFDEVTIDLTRPCFQKGQLYTALSRVKSPEGLRLIVNKKI